MPVYGGARSVSVVIPTAAAVAILYEHRVPTCCFRQVWFVRRTQFCRGLKAY